MQLLYGKYIGQLADYVLDLIESRRQEGRFRRAFLIVPDARTLSLEQRYLQRLSQGSLMRAEILSFGRLALRLTQEAGKPLAPLISAQTQALLIRDILLREKDKFKLLHPLAKKSGYLENLRVELASLRRLGFSAAVLAEMSTRAEQSTDMQASSEKFKELSELAASYDEVLTDLGRRDSSADLDVLAELLESWTRNKNLPASLKNTAFFVLGFAENRLFSHQEERVIHALEGLEEQVTLACNADYFPGSREAADQGAMAWRQGRRVLLKLSQTYPQAQITAVATETSLATTHAEKLYAAAHDPERPSPSLENLKKSTLIAAEDMPQLIDKALAYIQKKVHEENWRYQDFALCLCDSQTALRFLPQALENFGVPAFIDERESLIESKIFREIAAFMQLSLTNFDLKALCSLLRIRAMDNDSLRNIDLFENHCLLLGINSYKIFNEKYYLTKDSEERSLQVWSFAEQQVLPMRELSDAFRKSKSFADATAALRQYLLISKAENRLQNSYQAEMDNGKAEAARSISLSWNSLLSLIEDSARYLTDSPINAADYREVFVRAASSSYIGAVPSLLDEVYVGNPHTCLSQRPKQLILMNPTVINLPGRSPRQGVLHDLDYLILEEQSARKLPLAPEDAPFEDSFFIQQLLASGSELPLIARSKEDKAFPHFLLAYLHLDNYKALDEAVQYQANTPDLARLYSKQVRSEKARLAKYGKNPLAGEELRSLKLTDVSGLGLKPLYSASRLERYNACPYSYLMQHVLGIGLRKEAQLDDLRGGSLRHLLLEQFFTPLLAYQGLQLTPVQKGVLLEQFREQLSLSALTEKLKQLYANGEVFERYLEAGSFGKTTRPLLQSVSAAAHISLDFFNEQSRWPLATEWSFGRAGHAPLVLNAASDSSYQVALNGVVDRIDLLGSEKDARYEIIDYKSSLREIDYIAMWEGLDLQIPIYLLAVKDAFALENKHLGEASYFQLKRFRETLFQSLEKKDREKLLSSLNLSELEREVMLAKSEYEIIKSAKAIEVGEFPLSPRSPQGKYACTYCEAKALCSFDRPRQEVQVETESNKNAWLLRAATALEEAKKTKQFVGEDTEDFWPLSIDEMGDGHGMD